MRPTDDRITIKPLPADERTRSGFIIPEEAKSKPSRGEVMYIGPGTKDITIGCQVGDIVLFPEHAGIEFNYLGVDLKTIRWGDVQMVLDREVLSAEEGIRKNMVDIPEDGLPFVLRIIEDVLPGTISQKLRVRITGIEFYLQGNILLPITDEVKPVLLK
jgi:chaperonin GroES